MSRGNRTARRHSPSRTVPRVGPLVDVHYLAKRWDRDYESARLLLHRLFRADEAAGLPPEQVWWIGFDLRHAQKLVNILKLRAAHPALFARHYVGREEYEDVLTRMARLEEVIVEERKHQRALAARVQKLERALSQQEPEPQQKAG